MIENNIGGGKIRTEAYKKLKVFLANPGRFCLTVLGSRGSGKHYAIERAFEDISKSAENDLCLVGLKFIDAIDIPVGASELNNLFKENEYKTIVVEDVDELNDIQQKILFKALSTIDGTFGIGENFNIRVVFTSSQDIDALRTNNDLLIGLFWDRISQLVVEFPSYKKEGEAIIKDFSDTWDKMKFDKIERFAYFAGEPHNTYLQKFLEDNADKFDGGFRDLDKIACLYFNYRIYHYGENKKIDEKIEAEVAKSVKNDFMNKSQLQDYQWNDNSVFRFEKGLSHQELLGKYKIQLRKWAVKEYGTIAKAEVKLGFRPGSMKNYVENKVTSSNRAKVGTIEKK